CLVARLLGGCDVDGVTPQHLVARPAVEALRARVPVEDAAVRVRGHHGIADGVEHQARQPLCKTVRSALFDHRSPASAWVVLGRVRLCYAVNSASAARYASRSAAEKRTKRTSSTASGCARIQAAQVRSATRAAFSTGEPYAPVLIEGNAMVRNASPRAESSAARYAGAG